jgi:ribonucleoside-diphosphate reductase alpha chain
MQKFIDQTISANTSYDPGKYEGGKVPMKVLIQDLLTTYKLGVKTLYYHNTRDGATDSSSDSKKEAVKQPVVEVAVEEDEDCAGGACKI